ncbi:carboxypeptidase-like regulatory domain-containing protein [Wenyingzhuangia sp. 1_MG-2023]|nr:carboxypeptidase-like regulatory domain-containing protein [Wenyingzhuangia sp. 1_MG-2023]
MLFNLIKAQNLHIVLFSLFLSISLVAQQRKEVSGVVIDETNETIPFVTVGVVNKTIGTASTEDGEFSFYITQQELQDTLYVSSLGFDTYKIKIQDFLAKKNRKIVLTENVVSLNELVLLSPNDYVENAIKNLRKNTLSKTHVKEILYRRAASEEGKAKFFVENFIKLRDRGPANWMGTIQITEARKSADYRYWKHTQWRHSINNMIEVNPLTPNDSEHAVNLKKFDWKKIESSSYEGEDVLILEGANPKKKWEKIIIYIGIDSYNIYRIERGPTLYIYKKHKSGKVHLSYFKNEWSYPKNMIPQEYLNTPAETLSYRIEAFVLNVETDKKKSRIDEYGIDKDMGSLDLPYHPEFWQALSSPPDTKFFKKNKSELEGLYGVPLEKQYELVNK